MRNVFFKAVPGLFRKKKHIETDNQTVFYNNKVMDSINKLQQTNGQIVDNILRLNRSTNYISSKTTDLHEMINDVKFEQEEELARVFEHLDGLTEKQLDELQQVHKELNMVQQKQQDKFVRNFKEIENSLKHFKSKQETNNIDMKNEHEILIVSLERLFNRIDDLQEKHTSEMEQIINKLEKTQQGIDEQSDIHLEHNKLNADLLYKLREHHFEFESTSTKEHENIQHLLSELRKEVSSLKNVLTKDESILNR
ncbi:MULTISPECIES: hypothetical protein [Bacillaceae]|uniref:Uncharacterized protein n=1 Tax=Evansella alkalicola TaxID=745819 RepID=A0ABS6JQT5_9BACI|nr:MULTISPECIES: hypothetical protein [Bacillaceae]MBU9720637.1 hypothetical protein [Bacillus alkalicola]